MTTIRFQRSPEGRIIAFFADDHSGYAEEGEDIVCAAISVLLQTTVFSLGILYQPAPDAEIAKARVHCYLPAYSDQVRGETDALLKQMVLGLMNIAVSYPEHVRLRFDNCSDWQAAFDDASQLKQLLHTFFPD